MLVDFPRADGSTLNVTPAYVAAVLVPHTIPAGMSNGEIQMGETVIRMQNGRGFKTTAAYTEVRDRLRANGCPLVEFARPDGRMLSVYPAHLAGVSPSSQHEQTMVLRFADGRGLLAKFEGDYGDAIERLGQVIDATPAPSTPPDAVQLTAPPPPVVSPLSDNDDNDDEPFSDPDDEDY